MKPAMETVIWKRLEIVIPAAVLLLLVGLAALAFTVTRTPGPRADPGNAALVAKGEAIHERHCASCHGQRLEGQANWKVRLPNGRMPAPPHDTTGHTWHHPDDVLFGITKFGVTPPYGPPGYQSDMPAFDTKLSDAEIWAVLAYIKSRWPKNIHEWRAEALGEKNRFGKQ